MDEIDAFLIKIWSQLKRKRKGAHMDEIDEREWERWRNIYIYIFIEREREREREREGENERDRESIMGRLNAHIYFLNVCFPFVVYFYVNK